MKARLIVYLLLRVVVPVFSQEPDTRSIEQLIADLYEQYSAETEEEIPDIETFYEELTELASQPLSINSSQREELERLLFITPSQVENILYHRYTYGAFTSLYELQLVEGLDMTDIRRMLPFITLGDSQVSDDGISWWEVKKYGKHELYNRTDFGVETKKGYMSVGSESPGSAAYTGDRVYSSLKYRFDFRDRIRFNITAEKDAGEPWWDRKGVGFVSTSLQVRPGGWINNLVVGDFTAGFGQGLVLRQGFRRSKSSMVTQVMNVGAGFKRYASTNEHQFFRGIAASVRKSHLTLHAFASHRLLDASFEDSIFKSIYTTGLHRTHSEQEKRDRVGQSTAGATIIYSQPMYEIGYSGLYTRFTQPLLPTFKPYNQFYFSGEQQFNSGINYRFRWLQFNFFGETALSGNQGVATLNGLLFAPSSRVNVALVHRYYSHRFNSLFASAFSAQSRVGNEQGMYIGIELFPIAKWKMAAYADSYRFPWLRFGVDAPSYGNDFLVQLQHSASRKLQLSLRYRYRQAFTSQRDERNPVVFTTLQTKWSGRFMVDYNSGPVQFRQSFEVNQYSASGTTTPGYAAWQDVSTQLGQLPLKLSWRYLVFNAPANDNRIYTYEADVLHAFSSPSFSGKGNRMYLVAQYVVADWLSVWLKASQLRYADGRMQIGSGNEQIMGTKRTEFHILLRFRHRNH